MAGVTTPEGIVIPAGGDTFDYLGEQRRMAASQRTIVPVANPAAAAVIISAMAADGRTVSATNPLVTWDDSLKTVITYTGTTYPFGKLDYAALRGTGAQTFTNSTFTTCTFTTLVEDSNGLTTAVPTQRITIKQAGRYHIIGMGATSGTTGRVAVQVAKNGTTVPYGGQLVNTSGGAEISAKVDIYSNCVVGDYFTLSIFHEAGGTPTGAGAAYSIPFLSTQQISFA